MHRKAKITLKDSANDSVDSGFRKPTFRSAPFRTNPASIIKETLIPTAKTNFVNPSLKSNFNILIIKIPGMILKIINAKIGRRSGTSNMIKRSANRTKLNKKTK